MKVYLLMIARKNKRFTQKELSAKVSISLWTYNRIEKGMVSPRIDLLENIFKILELTRNEKIKILLGDEE